MIFVCPTGIVIVHFIPKALGCNTHSLAIDLSDNALHNDFIARHVRLRYTWTDRVNDVLSLLGVLLGVFQVFLDDLLNNALDP